jgi:hypothetical protein
VKGSHVLAAAADWTGTVAGEDIARSQGRLHPVGDITTALALGFEQVSLAVRMQDRSIASVTLAALKGGVPHPAADVGFG